MRAIKVKECPHANLYRKFDHTKQWHIVRLKKQVIFSSQASITRGQMLKRGDYLQLIANNMKTS